jgi:signal transduction histidine kinase
MSIKLERQRISTEMHDEIGAGISAIKLYTELASRNREDVEEIREIGVMVNDIVTKINEIIWSINSETDSLESLLYYIEEQTRKLFDHSSIKYSVVFPTTIPKIKIVNDVKRNIYLIIKETCNNVIKHSQATTVNINISISNGLLIVIIKDDGIGFNPNEVRVNAMGLSNLKFRAERLNASLIFANYKGTVVTVRIPLKSLY